jgi:hypothetical protein
MVLSPVGELTFSMNLPPLAFSQKMMMGVDIPY